MWPILSCLLTLATIYFTRLIYKRRNPSCKGNLPPGSLGLPLIGETLAFFAPYTASDLHPFVRKRMDRYGPVFKTSVVGQPFIVSADEDLNRFIFQQEGRLFESWWPRAVMDTFGQQNVGHMHGVMYKYLKSLILSLFGVESLKETLLPETNLFVRRTLHEWVTKPSVEVKDGTAAMIFGLTAKKLISYEDEQSLNSLRQSFVAFVDGLISFPLDIPGTAHHKCMEGRRNAMKVLREMLHDRRKSPQENRKRDFFDRVIDELNKEKSLLTEGIALDLMFALLFASFETTSLALTLALKYLIDHPQVLAKVTVSDHFC
ncbi:cytochrome P450 87A3-like [Aristolochia californica]|uniref:cytochrome P450 87A3-like n=1 Tax=Aristolochia californica TaxID=171875 RepID=UPI0035E2B0D4